MKITKLMRSDVLGYYQLIKGVILGTKYYSIQARKAEAAAYTPAWLRSGISNKRRLLLAAKDRNKVVGFLFGYISCGMLHLIWLGVDARYRKKEVAKSLILAAEAWAKGKVHKIWFDTRVNNKESISLVKKLKYKKAALLKNIIMVRISSFGKNGYVDIRG